jgi:hypothetical protein
MKAMAILLYGMGWGSVIAVRIRAMNSRRSRHRNSQHRIKVVAQAKY